MKTKREEIITEAFLFLSQEVVDLLKDLTQDIQVTEFDTSLYPALGQRTTKGTVKFSNGNKITLSFQEELKNERLSNPPVSEL